MIYIISFTLVILAAFFVAVMDTLRNHFSTSIFKELDANFWNAATSYLNKYIDRNQGKGRTYWKVLGVKVIKPAIVTDGWHLAKFFMQLCIGLAFGTLTPYMLGLPAFFIAWYLGFEPFYSNVLSKNKE